jgi:uncharacterized protein (DUF983 family)
MFCPKCGRESGEDTNICDNCGLDFTTIPTKDSSNTDPVGVTSKDFIVASTTITKNINIPKTVIFSLIAAVVLVMSFYAASKISKGGLGIMGIESVGGKTLEEAYYFQLGYIYSGYSMIARVLGIFFASVLVLMGIRKE